MTGRDHNKLLSIFFFVYGGLLALIGLLFLFIYGGLGVAMMTQNDSGNNDASAAGGILILFAVIFGLLFVLPAGFAILSGWRLIKEKPNAKIFGIIASIICLLNFPLGTAIGVYGLWFLFGDQGRQFYDGGGNMTGFNSPPPPPTPNYWQ